MTEVAWQMSLVDFKAERFFGIANLTETRMFANKSKRYSDVPVIVNQLLLFVMYQFQSHSRKSDRMGLRIMKPTNQVSPSSGFRFPRFVHRPTDIYLL